MTESRQIEFPGHVVSLEAAAALKAAVDALLTSYSHTAKEVCSVLSDAAQRTDIAPGSRAVLDLFGAAIGGLVVRLERQEQWSRWAAPELHNDVESVDFTAVRHWISEGGSRPF